MILGVPIFKHFRVYHTQNSKTRQQTMENLLFLGVPILKHITLDYWVSLKLATPRVIGY